MLSSPNKSVTNEDDNIRRWVTKSLKMLFLFNVLLFSKLFFLNQTQLEIMKFIKTKMFP